MCQVWQVIPQPEAQLPSGFQPSVGGRISSSSQQLIGQSQCSGADAGARLSSGVPKETKSQDWGCVVLVRRHGAIGTGADKYNGSSSDPNKALRVNAWLAVSKFRLGKRWTVHFQ